MELLTQVPVYKLQDILDAKESAESDKTSRLEGLVQSQRPGETLLCGSYEAKGQGQRLFSLNIRNEA